MNYQRAMPPGMLQQMQRQMRAGGMQEMMKTMMQGQGGDGFDMEEMQSKTTHLSLRNNMLNCVIRNDVSNGWFRWAGRPRWRRNAQYVRYV